VVVLADANHYIQQDAPDEIADAVVNKFGSAPDAPLPG
jgi:hypothetical protein